MLTKEERIQRLQLLSRRLQSYLIARGQGKEFSEIANELGVTEDAVKQAMGRIYASLGLSEFPKAARTIELNKYAELLVTESSVPTVRKPRRKGQKPTANVPDDSSKQVDQTEIQEGVEEEDRKDIESLNDPVTMVHVLEDEIELIKHSTAVTVVPPLIFPETQTPSSQARPWLRPLLVLLGVSLLMGAVIGGVVTSIVLQRPAPAISQVSSIATITPEAQQEVPVGVVTPQVATPLATQSIAQEPTRYQSFCGEPSDGQYQVSPVFLRDQGVVANTVENTQGAMPSNYVRSIVTSESGLWIGTFPSASGEPSGLSFTNRKMWQLCNYSAGITDQSINDVAVDTVGNVWVATDGAGVSVYDGESWQTYDTSNGLPSNDTYTIALHNGLVWVATWEGVAVFDGGLWRVPYSVANGTLVNDHVHAISFGDSGDIWIGYIDAGISIYDNESGEWKTYTDTSGLGSNKVRQILIQTVSGKEIVWVATYGGGISMFADGAWTTYNVDTGLLSDGILGFAVDRYNRVWAATEGGVMYYDGQEWHTYHTLRANDVAVGVCQADCPITDDMVWTATTEYGLTFSRIPLPEPVVDVLEVRYPSVVAPGERFYPEVVLSPRSPYQFREDRGDFLSHVDFEDSLRFGAWNLIPAKGIVLPGEPFVFKDVDNPFVAPELADGETERTFRSTWRMWLHTRYVGPPIVIEFTVRDDN